MFSHIFTFNYDLLQMFVETVNIIETSIQICFRVSLNRRKIACWCGKSFIYNKKKPKQKTLKLIFISVFHAAIIIPATTNGINERAYVSLRTGSQQGRKKKHSAIESVIPRAKRVGAWIRVDPRGSTRPLCGLSRSP